MYKLTIKNISFLFMLFIFLFINPIISFCDGPTNPWTCGTVMQPENILQGPIGPMTMDLVIVYVDFPDGRLPNGNTPTTPAELLLVPNKDAVSFAGYLSENGTNFNPIPNKYTYDNMWNFYFSEGTYIGNEAHPDWMSHGRFGLPYNSGFGPGDTARAYGSVKDYYKEVTYNQIVINPYITHQNNTGIYRTGVVNNIAQINGNSYIKPVKMPHIKGVGGYNIPSDNESRDLFITLSTDAATMVTGMHNLSPSDPDYLEFDLANYAGRIIFVFAGGTKHIGGLAIGNRIILREQRAPFHPGDGYESFGILNGPTIACHELGHTIGFDHSHIGNYCVMSEGTDNQNCPSHFNILYKLKAGWIDPSYIRKVNSNQDITDLPPSEYNGDCALLTIYGKAGYDNKYDHSQYFIFENRRMLRSDPNIKFDKKFVWKDGTMPPHIEGQPDFNGGCLVTRSDLHMISADVARPVDNLDEGHSNHFFGVNNLLQQPQTDLTDARTYSVSNIRTGMNITNIHQLPHNSQNMSLHLNYSLGEPPNYDFVIYGQSGLPDPLTLSGNVFVQNFSPVSLNILSGTNMDYLNTDVQSSVINDKNIVAEGTQTEPIIFRGAGYQQYRVNWEGIILNQTNSYTGSDNTIFKYCNFNNMLGVPNGFGLDISKYSSTSSLLLENLVFSNPNSRLGLHGNNNLQNRSVLSSFLNVNPSIIFLTGTWRFDIPNDFYIGQNTLLNITGHGGTATDADILFTIGNKITSDGGLLIKGNFTLNRDIDISNTGTCAIYAVDRNEIPDDSTVILFNPGYGINCNGQFTASTTYDTLSFRTNGPGLWNGINCKGASNVDIKNSRIMDAATGINIYNTAGPCNIQYSRFFRNNSSDINISQFSMLDETLPLINNNIFEGNANKLASIICQNGNGINIQYNSFFDEYNIGLSLLYAVNPKVNNNIFKAVLNANYSPIGIQSFSSGGSYTCNDITNFSNGILFDYSSPSLLNNYVYNNGYGLYLTNSSNPVLAPSYSPDNTLINAGYNKIHDNLISEIYCNNQYTPLSLPYLFKGSNSIYNNNGDYLIDVNTMLHQPVSAEDNYWGGDPTGRFNPDGSVSFIPYLADPPQNNGCSIGSFAADNSSLPQDVLLLGSANTDFYNGIYSSAVYKYKQIVSGNSDIEKSYLPLSRILYSTALGHGDYIALANYYNTIEQQNTNDSVMHYRAEDLNAGSVVEQLSYDAALNDYQTMISGSTNWYTTHYANIDKMRTIALMLDSLLNGYGNHNNAWSGNGKSHQPKTNISNDELKHAVDEFLNFKPIKQDLSKKSVLTATKTDLPNNEKLQDTKNNKSNLKSLSNKLVISVQQKVKNLDVIKQIFSTKNFNNVPKEQIVNIINFAIMYKIYENNLLNNVSAQRPLTRMKGDDKHMNTVQGNVPKQFQLYQNYPNPFNPETKIKYDLPKDINLTIKVYDLLGREVAILLNNEFRKAGQYESEWNASNFSSGIYFYKIEAGTFIVTKKMVLIK